MKIMNIPDTALPKFYRNQRAITQSQAGQKILEIFIKI